MANLDYQEYILLRDAPEAQRLEQQHRCYLQSQGYHLHPDIDLPEKARVAEVATGTTIWLREFAQINPSTECHGFDISDAMFPSELPADIKLHLQDMKQPFDKQWHAYFDVLHIRLVQLAMNVDDWALVLKNLLTLVKPGGWIQWGEIDVVGAGRNMPRASQQTHCSEPPYYSTSRKPHVPQKLKAWRQAFRVFLPYGVEHRISYGFLNLERLFEDPEVGNLDNVYTDAFGPIETPELRQELMYMGLNAIGTLVRKAAASGKCDIDYEQWQKEAFDEIQNGAYIPFVMATFIGQKRK